MVSTPTSCTAAMSTAARTAPAASRCSISLASSSPFLTTSLTKVSAAMEFCVTFSSQSGQEARNFRVVSLKLLVPMRLERQYRTPQPARSCRAGRESLHGDPAYRRERNRSGTGEPSVIFAGRDECSVSSLPALPALASGEIHRQQRIPTAAARLDQFVPVVEVRFVVGHSRSSSAVISPSYARRNRSESAWWEMPSSSASSSSVTSRGMS